MAHAAGGLINWLLAGMGAAIPGWALGQWGREVLFGPRDRTREGEKK